MTRRFQFSFDENLESGLFTIDDLRLLLSEGLCLCPASEEVPRVRRACGIIDAMTARERQSPLLAISHSRRLRIAIGAGASPSEVIELIRYCDGLAKVVRQMAFRRHAKSVGRP